MPPCCRQVEIDMRVDLWPYPTVALFHVSLTLRISQQKALAHARFTRQTTKAQTTASLEAIVLATRAGVRNAILKLRAAESPTSRSACLLVSRIRSHPSINSLWPH